LGGATVSDIGRVGATILSFAFRCAVLIFIGACIVGVLAPEKGVPACGEAPGGEHMIAAGNGRRVRITAAVAEADTASELVLRDDEGSVLLIIHLLKNGLIEYCVGGDTPGSEGYLSPDGSVAFSLRNGRGRCSILRKADGKVFVEERSNRGVLREFLVDPERGFLSEPPSAAGR
jgi:hypothetical protein